MVALGTGATGVFSTSSKDFDVLSAAGRKTGDRVWRKYIIEFHDRPYFILAFYHFTDFRSNNTQFWLLNSLNPITLKLSKPYSSLVSESLLQ